MFKRVAPSGSGAVKELLPGEAQGAAATAAAATPAAVRTLFGCPNAARTDA